MRIRNLQYPPRAAREQALVLSSQSFRNPAQPGRIEFPASTACSERSIPPADDRSAEAESSPHGAVQRADGAREALRDRGILHARTRNKRRLRTYLLGPDSNERALRRPDCGLVER